MRLIGLFLSGICHQLPEHTYFLAGVQMPLCARCTGTFVGASLTIANVWLRGRGRAGRLPPLRVLIVLGVFFAFWAIDGLNSYWHFVSGRVLLYVPNNLLRLTAGLLDGVALSLLILPMFNTTLWRVPDEQRVVNDLQGLAGSLLPVIALGALLQAEVDVLLYPMLLADLLSVLLLLSIVNSMIVMIGLRWENLAKHWWQAARPLMLGLVLAVAEVGSIAVFRATVWKALA